MHDTCRVAEEVGFSKIHIFPFSPRRTTPAAEMPDQVAPQAKAERVERLAELERQLADRYFRSLIGRELQVMIESPVAERPGYVYGTSCRYAIVEAPAGLAPFGRFAAVKAAGVANGRILAAEGPSSSERAAEHENAAGCFICTPAFSQKERERGTSYADQRPISKP